MTILVTGSAGHLGEAIVRTLRAAGSPARGIDRKPSPFTDELGSIVDPGFVRRQMAGVTAVIHTATLHMWRPTANRTSSIPMSAAR